MSDDVCNWDMHGMLHAWSVIITCMYVWWYLIVLAASTVSCMHGGLVLMLYMIWRDVYN